MNDVRPGLAPAAIRALNTGHRIVITGASGWLGSATIRLLYDTLGDEIYDRIRCFGSNARTLDLGDGLRVDQAPLSEIGDLSQAPTTLLHFAYLTKDRVAGMDANTYSAANAALSGTVLAALGPIGVQTVFVASSGAARAAADEGAAPAMRLYGEMKLRDEATFAAWAENHGKTAVIARIFNVAGPYINKHQDYALASFINDALAGRTISVRAPHQVVRGFIAIRELMSLVFALTSAPAGVYRFDTGGDGLELGEVAARVASALDAGAVSRAPITSERIDHYVGDRSEYDSLCATYDIPAVPFADQVRETADYLVANARLLD